MSDLALGLDLPPAPATEAVAALPPVEEPPEAPPAAEAPPAPAAAAGEPPAPDAAPPADAGLPPAETGLEAPPDEDADSWDVLGAAWKAETVRTDAWNYTQKKRRDLAQTMYDMLQPEAKMRIQAKRWDYENNWIDFEDMVLAEAAAEVPTNPTKFGNLPLSREQFDARIDGERLAELKEAEAILDQPGGGVAEFVGSSARAMTDKTSLMLLPFGVSGSAWRTIAGEAALGGLGEAAVLPREYEVASELGIEEPNAVARIAAGAVLGGGLSAGLIGIGKGIGMLRARRTALRDAKPQGMDDLDFEVAVEEGEAQLRGDRTVQEVIASQPEPGTLGDLLAPADAPEFSAVLEAGSGYTVVAGPDGQALRREGTRAWRNNNPGNIEYGAFARANGAIGTDGRFAVFPSYEAGRNAKATLLWNSRGYRGLTIGQAIRRYAPDFENDTNAYTAAVARGVGAGPDTPMSSLSASQRLAMLDAMERVEGFRPGTVNGVAAPRPSRGATLPPSGGDAPVYSSTSRGYTGTGQVTAGDNFRIDVGYEVVDLASLTRASGDLQPRDRSRINSDAWIADTAARLDPAQLMPSPTADRGAPIVGPDGVIESGNGRFGAIERAYVRHPDRAAAYRQQIEAAGFAVPEGMERPVLIARRQSELSPEDRARFAIEAQDSGVAAMTPTEVAHASSRAMTAPVLLRLDPSQPLSADANGAFVRAALAALPRSARNAMFDAGGMLNKEGQRQLRQALFARAWPDRDILARFTETDAGELKSLMDALDRAAPAWAALRADIEDGAVRPEMDISGYVLDAMRLIGAARDLSAREGLSIGRAVAELLDEVDLLEGAVAPLTAALVKKFWRNGRAASADDVAGFLTRYADDARKAGKADALFGGPTPTDVLRAIDKETFADLPEDLGPVRGRQPAPAQIAELPEEGFDAGASSPEAEAADAEIVASIRDEPQPEAEPPQPADAPPAEIPAPDAEVAALREDLGDFEIDMPDGTTRSAREILDDLDDDDAFDAFVQACAIIPGEAA